MIKLLSTKHKKNNISLNMFLSVLKKCDLMSKNMFRGNYIKIFNTYNI